MKKLLLSFLLVLPIITFGQENTKEDQLKAIAARINSQEFTAESWSSFKPVMDDFQSIFSAVDDVGDAWMYTEPEYMDLTENGISINKEYSIIEVKSVLAAELAPDLTHGFPVGYGNMANRIKPNVRLYMITYLPDDKKSTESQMIDIFFHVNQRWVFIPKAYQAFE